MTVLSAWGPIASAFLMALGVSLVLVPVCRTIALRLGYVARPKQDRWHARPTALFGGVAIVLTVIACVTIVLGPEPHLLVLGCGALVFVVGLVDDILSLKPSTKLVAQIAIASIFVAAGLRLGWTTSLTGDALLTIFWIVGVTNAFNLLDNMDGLCAGIAVVAGVTWILSLLPAAEGTPALIEARYVAVLLGATAGFLVYNFHPASIFMGDSGSLFIGLNFAALALTSSQPAEGMSSLLSIVAAPVLVVLIPIFDTTLVTVSRMLSGRSAATGGRDHTSHRLVSIGLSERTAVAVLWALAGMAGAIALLTREVSGESSALIALMFLTAMIIFAVYLARVRVYEGDDLSRIRQGTVTPIVVEFMYKRRVAEVLLDFFLVSAAYYIAHRLRFEGILWLANFENFMRSLPVVLATQMVVLFALGAYRGVWRYFGLMDSVLFGAAALLGAIVSQLLLLYLHSYFDDFRGYSRAVFVIYTVVLFLLLSASRASFRLMGEFINRSRRADRRLVIYGAGDGGSLAVRELITDRHTTYRMLGFIDDDPQKKHLRVNGYRVLGDYQTLMSLVAKGAVDDIVVSSRRIDLTKLLDLERLCVDKHVSLLRLQFDLVDLTGLSEGPRIVRHDTRKSAS